MSGEKTDSTCGPDEDSEESVSGSGSGATAEPPYLCDSQDWVGSHGCSPEEPSTISPVLAEETFRYMTFLTMDPSSSSSHPNSHILSPVLSAKRVGQMTKIYSDMDMVTHLLAERDRDLELAARIGQSLLQRNHQLQERNTVVEEQLIEALDQMQQLQHVLNQKDELLRMVARVSEESETDSSCSTPLLHSQPLPATLPLSQLEALQSKLQQLEEENQALHSEACHLETETITYEEKEQELVNDCVRELREANSQMVAMTDELSKKNDDLLRHQEDTTQLLSQMVEQQHRLKKLALEKEELRIHLLHSKEAQRRLTAELNEVHGRNVECMGMLQESQEEVKELRSQNTPCAGMRRHQSYGLLPMDSLAAEIEGSMRRELSLEEFTFQDQKSSQERVFQTVRSVNESVHHLAPRPIPGSAHSDVVMTAQPFLSSVQTAKLDRGEDSAPSSSRHGLGRPGSPGGSDLVSALHRLSLRQQNFQCEGQFFQAERDRKLQALVGAGPERADGEGSGCSSPNGSVISCVSRLPDPAAASCSFKSFLPEKLQIVKPIEGSLTLHHWQQLAQPHLATILDPHPGVVTKGFHPLPQDAVYRITDLEEENEEERGRSERVRLEEDEEDEEVGITFQVQCTSTPEEKREWNWEKTPVCSPATVPLLSPPPEAPPTPQQPESHIFSTPAPSAAHNPGKSLSSTFSTYTFTTCRILHPCDITQVSPSSSGLRHYPSSLCSGPSTPVTPCQLSLGDSPPPRGLAQLLLECGISAQGAHTESGGRQKPAIPSTPSTPPNSPCHSPPPSPVPSGTCSPPPSSSSDTFLASRPAELYLQEVYGLKLGRPRPDPLGPAPPLSQARASVCLVERLRRLGLAGALQGAGSEAPGIGSVAAGLRRNHSLPALTGRCSQTFYSSSHLAGASPSQSAFIAFPITPWGNLKEPIVTLSSSSVQALPPPHKT